MPNRKDGAPADPLQTPEPHDLSFEGFFAPHELAPRPTDADAPPDTEFRAEAVKLGDIREVLRQVAMDLGISNETLGVWVQEARAAGPPLSIDERAELVELRRRVKVLETEREIPKNGRPVHEPRLRQAHARGRHRRLDGQRRRQL